MISTGNIFLIISRLSIYIISDQGQFTENNSEIEQRKTNCNNKKKLYVYCSYRLLLVVTSLQKPKILLFNIFGSMVIGRLNKRFYSQRWECEYNVGIGRAIQIVKFIIINSIIPSQKIQIVIAYVLDVKKVTEVSTPKLPYNRSQL